ncbi:MAG: hypothetical protein HYV09_36325 [Deltaproteobacteria bacterium]|nr:hypothetical protein [Deltaproteobacteria bacterium]
MGVDARALGACAGQRSREQLGLDVEVSMRFARALAGLGKMLDAYGTFASDANDVLPTLAREPSKPATSAAFQHDPATGTYRYSDVAGGSMVLSLKYGADYEVGKTGEVIKPHFFLASSYLVGAVVTVHSSSATIESYESTGPLVELIGLGPAPPKTFTLDWGKAYVEIQKQQLEATLAWDHSTRGVRTSWRAASTRRLASVPRIDVDFRDVIARDERGGSIEVTRATITGTSRQRISGGGFYTLWDVAIDWRALGPFVHRGTFRYASDWVGGHVTTLECP